MATKAKKLFFILDTKTNKRIKVGQGYWARKTKAKEHRDILNKEEHGITYESIKDSGPRYQIRRDVDHPYA